MESLGYILTNQFIVIAVDTNFAMSVDDMWFDSDRIKKVHKLNDRLMISATGELNKIADIYTYIFKLNELGHNKTFDDTVENLASAFQLSSTVDVAGMKSLVGLTSRFITPEGTVDTEAFLNHLSSNPDLQAILKDAFSLASSGIKMPTTITLFEFGEHPGQVRMGKCLVIGNHLKSAEMPAIPKDHAFIGFSSSTRKAAEINLIEKSLLAEISTYLTPGWETSKQHTAALVQLSKQLLAKGLRAITPFCGMPNIVYYELSSQTGYIFKEPDTPLHICDFSTFRNE